MLSSKSCGFFKQEPSTSENLSCGKTKFNVLIPSTGEDKREDRSNVIKIQLEESSRRTRQTTSRFLFLVLLLAVVLIQGTRASNAIVCECNGEVKFNKTCVSGDDCVEKSYSCFCMGKLLFRSQCYCDAPNKPSGKLGKGIRDLFDTHDYDHPDHVSSDISELPAFSAMDDFGPTTTTKERSLRPTNERFNDLDVVDGDEPVVRHRKVYVSEKESNSPRVIPLSLTIPVKLDDPSNLPPPKPVFKMRKFTTYDSKPEVVQVPVTTTVIKPVGVSKDQIIGDEQSASNLFDK